MTPTIVIVGADKGGVGKTMITKVLLDYLKEKGIKPVVYDTEPEPGVLRRFYNYAKSIDIGLARGQVQVFDSVSEAVFTVVDLKAGSLSKVLVALRDAELLKDVHAGKMRMIIIHVLGSNEASLREISSTAAILVEGGEHFLIKNRATDGLFFEWDQVTYDSYFKAIEAKATLEIPHLEGAACDAVEKAGAPFAGFIADETQSRMLRGIVKHWRGLVFKEFDRAKVLG